MGVYPTLQSYFKSLFKADCSTYEVNFWWYGIAKGFRSETEANLKRLAHRQRITREIAPWDVVIRLAIKYTWIQLKEKGLRFDGGYTPAKCKRFISGLLWSQVTLVRPVKLKDGRQFNVQTFWSWAAENKGAFAPIGSDSAPRSLTSLFQEIQRRAGEK